LDNANLEAANFAQSNLSEASFINANLKSANFREANCLETDFTHAYLTGACLDAWNIDHRTQLSNADCQYVYLLSNGSDNPKHWTEQRPNSGVFQPGEFTKLFQEMLNTIDLIFQNGVDWRAFIKTFDQLRIENETSNLTIQSIENKGDGCVVVRVKTDEKANKEYLHQAFQERYARELKLIEERFQAEISEKSERIIELKDQVQRWCQQTSQLSQIIGTMADKQDQGKRIIIMGSGSTYHETTVSDRAQYAERDINNETAQNMSQDDVIEPKE
jgi:uncharacterized protein YjbI with pentapeptide repeats